MELKIVYDNEAKEGFMKGWGFSCLIGDQLLFDTGGNAKSLLFNMNRLDVKLENINQIVLSHEHEDHVGGIEILAKLGNVTVIVPKSFPNHFKRRLASYPNTNIKEVCEVKKISAGVFTTGEIGSSLKEHSLIVRTDNGLLVITGCAHPGLQNILRTASKLGEIYGVVGGFHSFRRLESLETLHLIVPCHYTIYKKEILGLYPESSRKCSAACVINI